MVNKWTESANNKIRYFPLLVLSIVVIILGFVFDPAFVSKYLSTDGLLSKATITKVYLIQALDVIFGLVLLLYSLIKITHTHFAGIIDEKLRNIDKRITSVLISLRFIKKDDHLFLKRIIAVWLIFLLFTMASGLLVVFFSWQTASGWEYLWIAESIERGNGFSFADCRGALWYEPGCDKYVPTAHEEPVYPYLMALATKVFGKYGRPAILILQVIALFFTSVFIYHLAIRVFNSPATGILAGAALPFVPGVMNITALQFIPVSFAGLMIVILTYLLFWCLDKPSVRRGVILGLTSGCTTLLYAPTLAFIPIFVVAILISKHPHKSIVCKTAIAVLLMSVIVLSFWTTRNYMVFGQIIPVRTGFGHFFFFSNPILAETFTSQSGDMGVQWKAKNAREAITLSRDNKKASGLYSRANKEIKKYVPGGYAKHQIEIDNLGINKTLEFIGSQPQTFVALTYYRLYDFYLGFGWKTGVIFLLFFISSIIMLRNNKVRIMVLLIMAYTFPYTLILAWFYRYRYPIEPLILVLACNLPVLTFSKLNILHRKS